MWEVHLYYEEIWIQTSNSEHTLLLKKKGDLITCIIIYIDDMIIKESEREEIKNLKRKLF